jgi:ABC-type phosphate transport system substrate-binding protein
MKLAVAVASFTAMMASSTMAQSVISIHGSGTTNPSKCYWHIMDQMQVQAKLPVKMTYRGVGSSTGQAEFLGNVSVSDNMFGSGDIPITAEDYAQFPSGSILHLPIVMGAISFFHSLETGENQLNLSPCLLAKILNRKITDWTDAAIIDENPNLLDVLPDSSPITVAHRVEGSSSTASITAYLHKVCSEEWPAELVGSIIEWPADTVGCEGSGGMTECITGTPGTIGYIDSGHGHAQELQEIELLNAANKYLNSKEAIELGGIISAANNADFPLSLDADFSDFNLLNQVSINRHTIVVLYDIYHHCVPSHSGRSFLLSLQGGSNTWPIVAMTYVYVKKDLTFIQDPAAQTLVKAFLRALYTDEYITQCEGEFDFVRVGGEVRGTALAEIDALVVSSGAPEWTFEFNTEERVGQGDYVISSKRESYSEVEQDNMVDTIAELKAEIEELHAEIDYFVGEFGHTNDEEGTISSGSALNKATTEDTQIKVALILSSISIVFWIGAIIALTVRYLTGSHSNSTSYATNVADKTGMPPESA